MLREQNTTIESTSFNQDSQSVTFGIKSDLDGVYTLYAELLTLGTSVPVFNKMDVELHPGINEVTLSLKGMDAPEYRFAMLFWYIYRGERGLGTAYFASGAIHNRS